MRTRTLVDRLTRRLIAVGLMAAIGAFYCCETRAESKVIHDSQVTAASYTTGEQGNQLKWLPYRPMKSAAAKSIDPSSSDQKTESKQAETEQAETEQAETEQVETRGAVVRWNDIEWTEPKRDGIRQVDFHDPPKPNLNASEDPLKNPFGDSRRPQSAKAKLARVGGPNLGAPLLHVVANAKNAKPLPGLAPNGDKDAAAAPRMLLTPPADGKGVAADGKLGLDPPSIAEELAQNPKAFMDKCPDRSAFKSIRELSDNVTPKKGKFPPECSLAHEDYVPRAWCPTTFAWTAAGTCHKPLYFEQPQVERYGHSWGPIIQPILSAGHFFVTVPILPYKMGMDPPGECMYSLGYYRPGSCAPYMLDPFPISVRGGLIQAGAVIGAAAIIP